MFDPQDQTLSYYIYGIRETVTVRSSVTQDSPRNQTSEVPKLKNVRDFPIFQWSRFTNSAKRRAIQIHVVQRLVAILWLCWTFLEGSCQLEKQSSIRSGLSDQPSEIRSRAGINDALAEPHIIIPNNRIGVSCDRAGRIRTQLIPLLLDRRGGIGNFESGVVALS